MSQRLGDVRHSGIGSDLEHGGILRQEVGLCIIPKPGLPMNDWNRGPS